jgi:hypothetical protein
MPNPWPGSSRAINLSAAKSSGRIGMKNFLFPESISTRIAGPNLSAHSSSLSEIGMFRAAAWFSRAFRRASAACLAASSAFGSEASTAGRLPGEAGFAGTHHGANAWDRFAGIMAGDWPFLQGVVRKML